MFGTFITLLTVFRFSGDQGSPLQFPEIARGVPITIASRLALFDFHIRGNQLNKFCVFIIIFSGFRKQKSNNNSQIRYYVSLFQRNLRRH